MTGAGGGTGGTAEIVAGGAGEIIEAIVESVCEGTGFFG